MACSACTLVPIRRFRGVFLPWRALADSPFGPATVRNTRAWHWLARLLSAVPNHGQIGHFRRIPSREMPNRSKLVRQERLKIYVVQMDISLHKNTTCSFCSLPRYSGGLGCNPQHRTDGTRGTGTEAGWNRYMIPLVADVHLLFLADLARNRNTKTQIPKR